VRPARRTEDDEIVHTESSTALRRQQTGTMANLQQLIGGVDFGEGPRWHDGALWYCDFFQHAIYTVTPDGRRTAVHTGFDDQMSGLGWLPDGRLLVVSMKHQTVLRDDGGTLVVHADLSAIAGGLCNDMVVDARGNAYVGNFGFDYYAHAEFHEADLALVRPDGSVEVAASGLKFPNGSVITPDGSTLIVGESFSGTYLAFEINADATLGPARQWAHVEGSAPDGCTLDADGGIWFADALGSQVVRVVEGGEVTHRVPTPMPTFACALGGEDGLTLFVLCAAGTHEAEVAGKAEGAIFTMQVDSPHAGLP
jgi:sugar lactone lactonase YvrE